ncbi:MAG: peptidase S41, partial [Fulvivirga sp.]|nr:peptidase S41 [Fulvivirga sp.]
KVYDGEGISPDIEIQRQSLSQLATTLLREAFIFRYANQYASENKAPADPASFSLSEEEYTHFKGWLNAEGYSYVTEVEKDLEKLIENARKEKYYKDIELQIAALKSEIKQNKQQDLETFKPEVKALLEREIVARFHLQDGYIEASLAEDQQVQGAINLLQDTGRYYKMLTVH